jgi:hypothetical protein
MRWQLCVIGICTFVVAASASARAGCASGQTPTYDDIRRIAVHRFALVGAKYPRFDADFALTFSRNPTTGVITEDALSATLDARLDLPLKGSYSESDPRTFSILRAVLQKHDFYALRLTPKMAYYLDGPEDTIVVTRCAVVTTIGYVSAGEEIDLDNGQSEALRALLDDLQNAIIALPWTLVPSPTPSI